MTNLQPPTVFIRHNLDSTSEILEYLWQERFIAIHYKSLLSVNPDDYDLAGKKALNRLWGFCKSGAIVGASFRRIKPNQMLIGEIEKGSIVELLDLGKLFECNNLIYKVVRLKHTREIYYLDHPILAAIQPRLSTITNWPSAEKYLRAIFDKQTINWSVKSLDPSQLEVICYEYLKMQGTLKALLLPIGRGLIDIDIFGIGEKDERILAQVTHSTNLSIIHKKIDTLKKYQSEHSRLFFFAPENSRPEVSRIDIPFITYISIEQVFSVLSGEKITYHHMLELMLNWER